MWVEADNHDNTQFIIPLAPPQPRMLHHSTLFLSRQLRYCKCYKWQPRQHSQYSDLLCAGRFWVRTPMGTRFTITIQFIPKAQQTFCTKSTTALSWGGVRQPEHGFDHSPPFRRLPMGPIILAELLISHTLTVTACNGIPWINIRLPLQNDNRYSSTVIKRMKLHCWTDRVWAYLLPHTLPGSTSSQTPVLLHSPRCLVCETELCYAHANTGVMLHFMVMTQH
jgi:hypothetical protein